MSDQAASKACALCLRAVPRTTRHHLTPRSRARKKPDKQRRAERDADAVTVDLCPPCHGMIHAVLTERQLQQDYASVEALRSHPEIARFLTWLARQPGDRPVSVRWSNDRRERRRRK